MKKFIQLPAFLEKIKNVLIKFGKEIKNQTIRFIKWFRNNLAFGIRFLGFLIVFPSAILYDISDIIKNKEDNFTF